MKIIFVYVSFDHRGYQPLREKSFIIEENFAKLISAKFSFTPFVLIFFYLFRYTICKKRTHSHFELLFFCSGSSLVGLQRVVMIGLFVSFHVGLQGAHELTHVTMVGDVVVVPILYVSFKHGQRVAAPVTVVTKVFIVNYLRLWW